MATQEKVRAAKAKPPGYVKIAHFYVGYRAGRVPVGAKARCGHIKVGSSAAYRRAPHEYQNCVVCVDLRNGSVA